MENENEMTKKIRKTPNKESKKKQRAHQSPNPPESKWQEFLRRHSATKEKK